jgi:tetratricopeptide (TPR) repeat protein
LIALPLVTITCFLVVSAVEVSAVQSVTLDDLVKRPIPLRTGIGSAHDAVSTSSNDAQAWYDQGLAYLHSYVWLEAARSFNQALRIDPDLAMAQIGLTFAYTELNAPAAARAAIERARTLERGASDHDRRHIAARALQMDAESSDRGRSLPRQIEYRAALGAALAAHPDDEELWLLRGHAESDDPAERGQGSGAAAIRFYEKARTLAPGHAAAHHYLTHAYENTGRIDEARAEGALYAGIAPNIPHARHMHGHDLRRAGLMAEAIEEFRAADALHTAWSKAEGIPPEYDWDYQHNLDLLATSYQYIGQMRNAEPLLKASFALASPLVQQELNKRAWPAFLRARGRVEEALAAANVMAAHRSALVSATGHVEAGRALLLLGRFQAAADEANAALRLMREATEAAGLVAKPLQELQGEFFLRTGQRAKGRTMLQDMVRKARLSPGPDAWTQTTFAIEAVARAARDTGDWELAGWAATQLIEHDANYAGAHLAQALAAEHDGDVKRARAEFERVRDLWSNADSDLPELNHKQPDEEPQRAPAHKNGTTKSTKEGGPQRR